MTQIEFDRVERVAFDEIADFIKTEKFVHDYGYATCRVLYDGDENGGSMTIKFEVKDPRVKTEVLKKVTEVLTR